MKDMMKPVCIVGAGFSGAVIANELARAGYKCDVFESRSHLAGNCHTYKDAQTGISVHAYGPHIFHTDNEDVWDYVCQFDDFMPYINRVKAISNGRVFSLPINLLTINSFYNKTLNPSQAKLFIESLADQAIVEPKTFEEQALRYLGRDLYSAFFYGYTKKQWGIEPSRLPASILKRLPVRFNYDDNYYNSRFQGIPRNGYTAIVERLLDHNGLCVHMNTKISRGETAGYSHVFYTGPLDAWFNYSHGMLAYRTLDFSEERHQGDYQGNAVINYCDESTLWTRICEHKHFSSWEKHDETVIYKEFSRECGLNDIPYYPVRFADEHTNLEQYLELAKEEKSVTFAGRLGTYRYLDMDTTIEEALTIARKFIQINE